MRRFDGTDATVSSYRDGRAARNAVREVADGLRRVNVEALAELES